MPDPVEPAAQKKTEFRVAAAVVDDGDVVVAVPATVQDAAPAPRAPTPVPSLNWDGDWPALAASLRLRGVVQQLAQQSELLQCEDGGSVLFRLRIPVDTLRSAGALDKLGAALTEHFGKPARVETEIGAVRQTANAAAVAEREARQREAEQHMQGDPFVQSLMREFGATIVPGSIKPA